MQLINVFTKKFTDSAGCFQRLCTVLNYQFLYFFIFILSFFFFYRTALTAETNKFKNGAHCCDYSGLASLRVLWPRNEA